ncbi:MAG: hypothetical protein U0U46_20735 [Saprospiraceae bacterium]
MNNTSFLFAATLLWFAACQNAEKTAPAAPAPAPAAEVAKARFPVHCYEQKLPDGSTISFQYTEYYDDVVGILDYSFYEKDGAHGTFKGKKEGNLIKATWNYLVEGATQSEEILVRIDGDKAAKASGELMEGKDGTLMLKDPATATWEETFLQVQCD